MPDFIIVGSDGTEHHFPEGMDPKAAIQVVKNTELRAANAKPLHEPTTFWAGARKGLDDYLTETGNAMFQSAAHPQTAGDFLGLMLPSSLGMSGGSQVLRGFKAASESEPVGNRVVRGAAGLARTGTEYAGKAADAIPANSVYAPAKVALKATQKVGQLIPSEGEMLGVEPYKPNVSGVPDRGVPQGEMPQSTASMVDQYLPNEGSVPDRGVPQGPMPQSTESMVDRNLPSQSGRTAEVDPDWNRWNGLDRYSDSNRAGIPQDGLPSEEMPTPPSAEVDRYMPNQSGFDPFEEALGVGSGEELSPGPGETGNPAGPPVEATSPTASTKPVLNVNELAQMMRRMYGSRDAGSMIYGSSLPPAEREAAVTRLAPGPSQTPLVAEQRIQAARGEAAGATGNNDLLMELLRSLGIKGTP